ncbi:hypothetical protein HYPSUDRAFT_64720 [Hypholoma sublateritium FD-334 SS-4]|uniref:Enoyl reductase (ER) domain-containing protein n=1 Tax=Hypholoma sublateritium (strain FD-334 SS-4) TaxID=945553 RepID=A0A0D2MNP1_HYPSF|nr:hypothetical protein HYPSUDRAFT_64720 [Hypholoma sublateritium FD-334 SS-4]
MSPAASSAAVLYGPRDVRVEPRLLWPPAIGHAQVAVVATGLCGSDLHYFAHGRNGDFAVRAPLVLGHEAAGIVTAVSRDADHLLHVGQRVAIEAGISCRACAFCDAGRYNLCKNMRFCSSAARFPHVDGTLQARINHPAHVLHPLPDDVSFELAALAEPLSVLIHAARRVQLGSVPNEAVLVFGVGAIGLLACALARHRGARRVVAVDINPQRLDFARRHAFADDVFCLPLPPAPSTADQVLAKAQATAAQLLAHFAQPDGFDVVFECTGAESAVQMSVYAAAPGARVMLVGMGTRAAYMPVAAFALREVDVRGSFRYAGTYPEALALLRPVPPALRTPGRATLPELVAKLVTHRFPLAETQRAFEMLARGTDDNGGLVLKVIVEGDPADAAA